MGSDILITSLAVSECLIAIVLEQAQFPMTFMKILRGLLFGLSFSFSRLMCPWRRESHLSFCSRELKVALKFTVGQPRTNNLMASVWLLPLHLHSLLSTYHLILFFVLKLLYLIWATTNRPLSRKRCRSCLCRPLLSSKGHQAAESCWSTQVIEMHTHVHASRKPFLGTRLELYPG